ncbi:hypothetical protein [Streptomyces sp. NPDC059783]|uniref:hypothetical protein n=1 Tax=Streptomyces sp. NPDC059783 TaxID=3346944 RepID=UPI0036584AA0
MGAVLFVLLVVLGTVAGLVLRQLHRYPGGGRFAFGSEHAAARRDLDTARTTLRGLERSAARELAAAHDANQRAATTHRRRVRRAEEDLAQLNDPGRGGYREELGDLSLYEFVLVLSTEDWSGELPLHETSVRSEHTHHGGHVYVTAPGGRRHLITYPAGQFDEEHVRRFVLAVHNTTAAAKEFRADRPRLLREARAELRRVREDTTGQAEASRRLHDLTLHQQHDPGIPRARQELDAARARWHRLTGHVPG